MAVEAPVLSDTPHGPLGVVGLGQRFRHGQPAARGMPGTLAMSGVAIPRVRQRALALGARWVVAFVHWGRTYQPVTDRQRRRARQFAGGVNPRTGERALPRTYVRDVMGVMFTCGMYDAAGQWAWQWANDVGIPAKSGVSGGIMASIPRQVGLGVFSPGLDVHGNSVRGINVVRELSERFGLHIFADPGETRLGRLGGRLWPEPEPEPEPGALDPEPRDVIDSAAPTDVEEPVATPGAG